MNKEQAILLAAAFAAYTPDAKIFFVTEDEKVFTNAEEAVANAVELSPGNPTVIDVSVNELVPVVQLPVVNTPVVDAPVVKAPVIDVPVLEAPVIDLASVATTYGKTPEKVADSKKADNKAK